MDDEWYDYLQHNFSMLIYLDEKGFHIGASKTEIQSKSPTLWFYESYEWSCIVYDKELDSVTKLSEEARINNNDSTIRRIDNYFHQLLKLYSKKKKDWNDEDELVLKIGGKALELFVNEARRKLDSRYKRVFTYNLHYAFVIHLDCMQADFEKKIVRPLFTQAHLINSSDHSSRLLVFTELEFLVLKLRLSPRQYQFTDGKIFNARQDFKKKDRYVIWKMDFTNENGSYWSCHPFEFVESIKFGIQESTFYQSTLVPKAILGFPDITKNKTEIETKVIDALSDVLQSKHKLKQRPNSYEVWGIMDLIRDYFYHEETLDRYILNNDNMNSNNDDAHCDTRLDIQFLDYYNNAISTDNFQTVVLHEEQQKLIKNVTALEVYNKLLAPIQSDIERHLNYFESSGGFMNNVNNLYIFPVVKTIDNDYNPSNSRTRFESWIARWIIRVLLHYEKSINYKLVICDRIEKEGFLSSSLYYNAEQVLDYVLDQLILRLQQANVMAPPYFLNNKPQEDILPPEEIIINSTTRRKREEYRLEESLPILQDMFDVNLELKAYYLQVEFYQEHIQLILNQVVKVASNEEDATSFVVEDRSISIENVYDSFCSRLINCGSLLDNQSCNIHYRQTGSINNNEDDQQEAPPAGALLTKMDYKQASINLKKHFNEILRSTDGLDLDEKRMVKVNDKCDCRFSLSIRDFINVTLIPIIKKITAVISGALINTKYFGRYNVNYVFLLLGNLFLEHNDGISAAFMMNTLATVVQEILEDSNQEKEIQPNCFYCTDTIESLYIKTQQNRQVSKSPIGSSPSLNVTTVSNRKDTLCPVSRERYGFQLTSSDFKGIDLFQQIDGTDKLSYITNVKHSPIIIVEKGQPIPIEGIQKVFYLKCQDNLSCIIDTYKMHMPDLQNHSPSGDCSSYHLGGSNDNKEFIHQDTLNFQTENHIGNRFSSSTKDLLMPIYFSIKYDHPDSHLKISIPCSQIVVDSWSTDVYIGHPLTLAYF